MRSLPPTVAVAQLDPLAGVFFNLLDNSDFMRVSKITGSEDLENLVLKNTYD